MILRNFPAVKPHLEPEQVGVGIKHATHCKRSQLLPKIAQEPRLGLLQIILKNAFNSLFPAAVLRPVPKAPEMCRWAKWSLGGENLLVCQQETMHGVRGVQKGRKFLTLKFEMRTKALMCWGTPWAAAPMSRKLSRRPSRRWRIL